MSESRIGLFRRQLDNPELSTDGKDLPLFLGKQVVLFLWVRECPRPFSPPPSLFLDLFSNIAPCLDIYTDADIDINTHTHMHTHVVSTVPIPSSSAPCH